MLLAQCVKLVPRHGAWDPVQNAVVYADVKPDSGARLAKFHDQGRAHMAQSDTGRSFILDVHDDWRLVGFNAASNI